jgi:hypothetical protein
LVSVPELELVLVLGSFLFHVIQFICRCPLTRSQRLS